MNHQAAREPLAEAQAQPISRLRVPSVDAMDEGTRARVSSHGGENWLHALALSPVLLERFLRYYNDLFDPKRGRLPVADRELVGVVVSVENGCGYCELNHLRGLARALRDRNRARRIALDHHLVDLTERQRAIVDLALQVTRTPKAVSTGDLDRVRAAGLDDEEILEVIEVAAWFNHTNRLAITVGILPDDSLLAG